MNRDNPLYTKSLNDAVMMMESFDDLEPRSALKQAASDRGIEYGDDMLAFVTWAEEQLFA